MSATEREREYARRWEKGGVNFVHAFNDLLVSKPANDTIADFVRARIRSIVKDAAVADSLCPNDHPWEPNGSVSTPATTRPITAPMYD